MNVYKIKITAQAKEHLTRIRDYIAFELASLQAAKHTLKGFYEAMRTLEEMPERCQRIDEMPWHELGFRKIRVKNYYIYFWIAEEEKEVQIIAVIYVKREQARQLESLKVEKE